MERPKEPINDLEMKAEEQLSTIRQIITEGERVKLSLVDDVVDAYDKLKKEVDNISNNSINIANDLKKLNDKATTLLKELNQTDSDVEKLKQGADDLGIGLPQEAEISVKMLQQLKVDIKKYTKAIDKSSSILFNA